MDSTGIVLTFIGVIAVFVAIKALPVYIRSWGFWGFCFWIICLPIPFAWIFLIYAAFFA